MNKIKDKHNTLTNENKNDRVPKYIKVYSVDLTPFYMCIWIPRYSNSIQSDNAVKDALSKIFKERFSYQYVIGIKHGSYNTHLSFDSEYTYDVYANLIDNTENSINRWAEKIFTEEYDILYW